MPDQSPASAPTPPQPPPRWTPYAVIGLLALVAGWVLRLIYEVDPEAVKLLSDRELVQALADSRTGLRVGDGLLLLGGSLLGWSPPLPSLRGGGGSGGSSIGTGLGVGIVLGTAALTAGCLAREVRAEHDAQVDWTPRPECRFEAFADGESVFTLTAPTSCEPPPNICPAPPAPTPTPEPEQ